jgi:thermitase
VLPAQKLMVVQKPLIQTRASAIEEIKAAGEFSVVEPNFVYRASKIPNDPKFSELWGMKNVGQQDSDKQAGVAGVDIDAERAWDITTGNPRTLVAIIDTGIDFNHPDLKANLWVNAAEKNGRPGVDDDNNGIVDDIYGASFVDANKPVGSNLDDHGHGSHCAGTIGGTGNDGVGVAGVNWNVKIMGVKFLGGDGSGSLEGALKAIDYATKMGAKVLSNSWGGGGFSQLLKESIERSNTAGALFVAAAANDGSNNDNSPVYPANYEVPNIISVAAIDNKGRLASFSNYGAKTVHIAAPGVNIYSSLKNGAYESWSGTSMATPHVSGVAALLIGHEPTLTNLEVRQRILAAAKPLAGLRGKVSTAGMLNAYYTLTGQAPPDDPNDPFKWTHANVQVSSVHPYQSKKSYEYQVEQRGAKDMAIKFSKFDTEAGYDIVTFYDRAGKVLGTMSGTLGETYSASFNTDFVKIVLTSDDSVDRYGFDISAVAYR